MADQELARDLGFLEAYTIGVGTMIGAGIFVLPSIAAANAGPASMISFAVGGVVSLLAALSLSELATGMPRAGGSYYYVNRALGPFFGSVVGVGMWSGLMFATAFYMLGFGQYLTYFYGAIPVAGSALVMALLLVLVNYRGVKEAGSLQNLIVVALIGLIVVFVGVGVFQVDYTILRPFNPNGWSAVAMTAATVYVSFIGFEVIATSAEEIKDPGRNLPLSMIASVLTPTVFYVLVMLVSTGVLPIDEIAASTIPVADVAGRYLGELGALAMVVGAVLATVSSANASILSAARVNFAMGRDRILSNWLNEVHPDYHTPYRAIWVTGGIILVLIAIGVGIETLADVASFTYLLTYALVHVAVIVMRGADPDYYEPDFRLRRPWYPLVPAVGFLSCILILLQMRTLVLALGGGIVLLGIAWFAAYAMGRARDEHLVGEAIAPAVREIEGGGAAYRIVVPVANPATERRLIELAAAVASEHEDAELVLVNVIEVPPQTALQQDIQFEERRVEAQQKLLDSGREAAEELGVGLRTRAIVGRNVWEVVLNVVDEERADHLMLGWTGERARTDHLLGVNIDRIVEEATCTLSLVTPRSEVTGRVGALVGRGPYSPEAARRAVQIAEPAESLPVTLTNVQLPEPESGRTPIEEGTDLITDVARRADLARKEWEAEVIVEEDDVRETLVEAAGRFDTVCVGATRSTRLAQALFGSIPETIGEHAPGTVIIVRGTRYRPRTIADALIQRLSLWR